MVTASERYARVMGKIKYRDYYTSPEQELIALEQEYQQQQEPEPEPEPEPDRYEIITITKGGGATPTVLEVVGDAPYMDLYTVEKGKFPTRESAEEYIRKYRNEFAPDSDVSVGVRKYESERSYIPAYTETGTFLGQGVEYYAPPPSDTGIELQRQRQELERIQEKVKVVDGKIDTSSLTSYEKARIKQITGENIEDAFQVQQQPTTQSEFMSSLLSRQILEGEGSLFQRQAEYLSKAIIIPPPIASSILGTVRGLPEHFQTPETQKAIAEASLEKAKQEQQPISFLGYGASILYTGSAYDNTFLLGDRLYKPPAPSDKELGQIERLTDLVYRIKRQEGARQQFLNLIGYNEGMENINKFWYSEIPDTDEKLPLGFKTGRIIARGGLKTVSALPFLTADILSFAPQIPTKLSASISGLLIPSTRKPTLLEMGRAGTYAGSEVIKSVTEPERLGGVLGVALIPALTTFGKSRTAGRVLENISKDIPKSTGLKGMEVVARSYPTKEIIDFTLKGDTIMNIRGTTIKKPATVPISKYRVEVERPPVVVGKTVGKTSVSSSVSTPIGTQYITTITKVDNTPYIVRTTVKPTQQAISTVYTWDFKPIKTFKYESQKPLITFLEPLEQMKYTEEVTFPDFTRQIEPSFTTSGVVPAQEGLIVSGLRVRTTRNIIQTTTEYPRMNIFGTPYYDFISGTKNIIPKGVEIFSNQYKYVPFLPEQQSFILTKGDFGVFIQRPATSRTLQKTLVSDVLRAEIFRIAEPTRPTISESIGQMFTSKKAEVPLLKQKTQTIEVFKPEVKSSVGSIDFYFPTLKTTKSAGLMTFLPTIVGAGSISIISSRLEPQSRLLPSVESITLSKSTQEFIPTSITENILISEPIPNIITTPEQDIFGELIPKEDIIEIPDTIIIPEPTITPEPPFRPPTTRVPPPPTVFFDFFGSKQRKEKATSIESQGYDVLIKRKQLKIGRGYRSRGYEKANEVPLTREGALGLGASLVDEYTNRSYMIRKSNQTAVKRKELELKWKRLREKFRYSKKRPRVITEKTKYAIDSYSEKEGIPYESARLRKAGLLNIKRKRNAMQLAITRKKKQVLQLSINSKISNSFLSKKKGKRSRWL